MASSSAAPSHAPPGPPTAEPRARRTHARRSCDTCKIRKTRCELPDLDVASSSEPLPTDKACHRCKVLNIPCVVDDSRMRRQRRKRGSEDPSSATQSRSQRGSASSVRTVSGEGSGTRIRSGLVPSRPGSRARSLEDVGSATIASRDMDVSAAFRITITPRQPFPQWESSRAGSAQSSQRSATAPVPRTVRLHGRPLSLLGALLAISSSKSPSRTRHRMVITDDVDLEELVDANLRTRLGPGYAQLRVLHPHLHPLADLFSILRESPDDSSVRLLLASALFVSSQTLGRDPEGQRLRAQLTPAIQTLQLSILARQPGSFYAIQALELLALHAPFSPVIPFQAAELASVSPARGLVGVATNIANALNVFSIVNGPMDRWTNSDFWMWLGLQAAEAQMAFEDDRPRKPAQLGEARALTSALISPENDQQWISAASMEDPAEVLGKLAVTDRLARLEELHDSCGRFRSILETVLNVPTFGGQQAINDEIEHYSSRLAEIDGHHDRIIGLLPLPATLASGWKAYRVVRRLWEIMKVYLVAFRMLVALHFLPGSNLAISSVRSRPHITAAQTIHEALSRANDPHDILLAYASTTMAADDMRRLSKARGRYAEQLLQSFLELSPTLVPTAGAADLVPLHEVIALVVGSAKVLMEQHASSLTYRRSVMTLPRSVPPPSWVAGLSQAVQILHGVGTLVDDEDSADLRGREDLSSGCSSLLSSMVRVVQEWSAMVERDGGSGIPAIPALAGLATATSGTATPSAFRFTSSPTGFGDLHVPVDRIRSTSASPADTLASGPPQLTGVQYLPSERWMSADGRSMSLPPTATTMSTMSTMSTPVLTSAPEYMAPPPVPAPAHPAQHPGEFGPIITDMLGYPSYGTIPTPSTPSPFDPRGGHVQPPPTPLGAVPLPTHTHGAVLHQHQQAQQAQPGLHAPPQGSLPQQQPQTPTTHGAQNAPFLLPPGYDEGGGAA